MMKLKREELIDKDWNIKEPYTTNNIIKSSAKLFECFDEFMANLGFVREGEFYRIGKPKYSSVLVVCHVGVTICMISRLFNLSVPFVAGTTGLDFTNISVIDFYGKEGELITPRIKLLNDSRHIKGIV